MADIALRTHKTQEMIDITQHVADEVRRTGVKEGDDSGPQRNRAGAGRRPAARNVAKPDAGGIRRSSGPDGNRRGALKNVNLELRIREPT
jgi:hypothetical protein